MRRPLLLLAAGLSVAAVAAGVVFVLTDNGPARTKGATPSSARVTIPGEGGTALGAYLIKPSGSGQHPLLVMPASWGAGAEEYLVIGRRLAAHGYVVVSYAQRGFGGSAGEIDFGGERTQADVGRVISWALAHSDADPAEVGAVGVSYGAGISLLAAARDPRIRAVVAMSAWTDLGASLYPNRTPSTLAVNSLFASGDTRRHLDAEIRAFATEFLAKQTVAAALTLAPLVQARSVGTDVAQLNRNHPAVLIANDYQDSYFAPSQLLDFFGRLTGPKRLELSLGDHGGAESPGLRGHGTRVWSDALAWLDRYLRGSPGGADTQDAIRLQDVRTGAWHGYPSWAATGRATTLYLGGRAEQRDAATGALGSAPATGWTTPVSAGIDSAADAPPIQVGAGAAYRFRTGLRMASISRSAAAVWEGAADTAERLVTGAPTVHLTVTPSTANSTVIGYLYDVDASGAGTLMTYKPYSLTRAAAGVATAVDLALEPITWTLPAGHRLALVIDTVDPRFQSLATSGRVTFGSPAGDPATLTVQLG